MKVVVAYPHRLISSAIACILTTKGGYEVVGHAQDESRTIELARREQPGAIVVGGGIFDSAVPVFLKEIKTASPMSAILIVSTAPRSDELLRLLEAGVSGFVNVDCASDQLVDAIKRVQAGEVVLSGVERQKLDSQTEAGMPMGSKAASVESLTAREKEVLALLSQGFSNRQIAQNLFLSEHTVRTHIQNLRSKLHVRSKFEAAMVTMRSGRSDTDRTVQFRF